MRYVLIRDDACVADIDEALNSLRAKKQHATLPVIKGWIQEDIDSLLDMRCMDDLERAAHHGSQVPHQGAPGS